MKPHSPIAHGLLCNHIQDVAEALRAALTPCFVDAEGEGLGAFLENVERKQKARAAFHQISRQELSIAGLHVYLTSSFNLHGWSNLDGLEIDVELQIDVCQPGHFGSPL